MASTDSTAPTQAASFDKLLSRLLNLVHHVQLVDQRLFDPQGVPPELQAAAVALHDSVEALDRLHTEFDAWNTHGVAGAVEAAVSRPKMDCFHNNENDLPIAGTPAPLPCPFCGDRDNISVVIERRSDNTGGAYVYARVQCDGCGSENGGAASIDEEVAEAIEAGVGSRPYCTALQAAKQWNKRGGL